MPSVSPAELQDLRTGAQNLRDEAKSVERRARLLKQQAAAQIDRIENLQSKEDTRE